MLFINSMTSQFTDNTALNRFEYRTDGGVAFARYRRKGGMLYIDHVEAPPELRGTGAAGKLMECIVARAREENLKIEPVCGYAAAWLQRHDL